MSGTSARLLALLSLLQARRDWPGQLLAQRLEVSPRTVRRDVERLRDLGYPVQAFKGPDGGYRLDAGADLPPLLFDEDQAVALAIALQVAAASGVGIAEAATRALTTVRQVMPSRLRHRVDALQVTAVRRSPEQADSATDPTVLVTLSAAIRASEVVRFDYVVPFESSSDTGVPRRVEPHHLVTRGGRWYLLSWDLDRDDWRTFRVDRISPRVPTGPRFVRRDLPGGDLSAFVAGRFAGLAGPGTWPCRGEVILGLSAATVAPYVSDDGIVEEIDGGRSRLVLGSWSWSGLAAAICRFDTDIEVVGPAELRDAFGVLAARCAAATR